MDCFSMFSEVVAAIYHYSGTLDGALEEFTPPNWRVSKIKRRLLQKDFEFSSELIKQQVLIQQEFQYNTNIAAFCHFW